MKKRSVGAYEIDGQDVVAEGADLQATVLTLGQGQSVPWHFHTEVTDHFVCLKGELVVETRAPRHQHVLAPGERCEVSPNTAHHVHGVGYSPCQFLLIQGVGVYDYVAVGGRES